MKMPVTRETLERESKRMPQLPRFLFGLISVFIIMLGNQTFADDGIIVKGLYEQPDIVCKKVCGEASKCKLHSFTGDSNTIYCSGKGTAWVDNNGNDYETGKPVKFNSKSEPAKPKKDQEKKPEPASKAALKKAENPEKKPEKEVVAKQKTTDIKTINSPNKVSRKRGETEARAEAVKATGLSEPFQCRSVNDDKPNYLCAGSDTGTNIKIVFAGWSEEKSAPKQPAKSANPDEYKYEDDNSFKDFTTFELDALKRAGNRHSGFMCEKTSSTMVVCTNEKNRTKYIVTFAKIYESKADFEAAEKANSAENPKNEPAGKEEPQSDENNELIEQIKSEAQQILDAYNKRKEELEKQKSSDK